jgi:hypothetical protein
MDKMKDRTITPFNSPYELGIRMVYMLSSLFPRGADLQKLVLLDYAIVYSADFGGPKSLHTPVPFRGNELYSRRELIQQGLYLMSTKGLVTAVHDSAGIYYYAGDNSRAIVDSLTTSYALELEERCSWAAKYFGEMDSLSMTTLFNDSGYRWGAEMQVGESGRLFS